jgi:hypothetical protein
VSSQLELTRANSRRSPVQLEIPPAQPWLKGVELGSPFGEQVTRALPEELAFAGAVRDSLAAAAQRRGSPSHPQ